jgi:hypothetical protein
MKPVQPISKQVNPQGRLDVLASQLLERIAQKHPIARAVHEELQPEIEALLAAHLGPRNPRSRKVTRAVRMAAKAISYRRASA